MNPVVQTGQSNELGSFVTLEYGSLLSMACVYPYYAAKRACQSDARTERVLEPGDWHEQHHRHPTLSTRFDKKVFARANRITIDALGSYLDPASALDGFIYPNDDRGIIWHKDADKRLLLSSDWLTSLLHDSRAAAWNPGF